MITKFKVFENIDIKQGLNLELVYYSSKTSSLQKMRELIDNGADVNYNDINDGTPLMRAATAMFYSGVKLLIENGADVNIKNRYGETAFFRIMCLPLSTIMKNKDKIKKIIDLFIINNVDLSEKNKGGNDIFAYLDLDRHTNLRGYIKDKFPNQYNEYIMKKEAEKYNL